MNEADRHPEINDTTCDVTVKIDPAELERTMKLSDEELARVVRHSASSKNDTRSIDSEDNTTSFFSLNRTSTFSTLFEKKKVVEDELAVNIDETSIESDNIEPAEDDDIKLHDIEDSFEIISKIGEGGQGVISSAADRSLGRIVALKSLHKDLLDKTHSRHHFIAEAKITSQLDYPGIVPIYSLNSDKEGGLHLAMKFINGETLADHLDRVRSSYEKESVDKFNELHSIRKRIEIFLRTCDAISYAHNRNVMHCDLKPENIMLGKYNDSYIMDWGIAKLIHDPARDPDNWEKPAVISGTPRYLSPEAIEGIYTDERADIYALGLILFECVFLKCAFNGKDTKDVLCNIKTGQIESFKHKFGVSVDRELSAIIRKAVSYEREDRYQSVNELAADIRAYLAHEETTALPDNIFRAAIRFCQRHIRLLLLLTLLGFIAFGLTAGYSAYRETQHKRLMLERDAALSRSTSNALYVANMIELQMNKIASALKSYSAYISFLVEYDAVVTMPQKKYFIINEEINNKNIPDLIYSPFHGKNISLERMSFGSPSGKFSSRDIELMSRLQRLQPLFSRHMFMENVLQSDYGNSADMKQAKKEFLQKGTPVLWYHCSLENGLYFTVPGQFEQEIGFDARKRDWYKAVENRTPVEDVVWSRPYRDAFSGKMTMTASIPIFLEQERFGVVAVDCMLQYISNFMKKYGNTDYTFVREKIICSGDGHVLLSTRKNYSEIRDAKIQEDNNLNGFFEDRSLFKIIQRRKNGVLSVQDKNGTNIVYLFAKINSLDWFYIEKIDLDSLMENIKERDSKAEK